ncbi:GNAT family N-acetyltransferase [Georgenia sp. 311]|uniref:GNAT family N-acetyltransferase n=1 Tax=Georgenia sp. 311 TaxID=2585134 RepID=UPI00159BCC64|nr:GNAT family N-acetyltransferase [Georgenia sp. 311]
MRYDRVKRALDLAVGGAALVLSAPVQLAVAALVRVKLGSPVLFRQDRPGKDGRVFQLVKFRTMLEPDPAGGLITNEQRMTPFGHRLRSTSLDELPTLLNVVRGDMSLVGPRPLRTTYLPRYSRRHARRHDVRPGLTGLAQVRGRNALTWEERLDLDIEYVDSMSPALDLSIVLATIRTVFQRSGIAAEGQATMSEFMGSGEPITCVPLVEEHLPARVEWLNDPRVRAGITISFQASLEDTVTWFRKAAEDETRADFACVSQDGSPVSMFGITDIADGSAALYLYVAPDLHAKGIGRLTMVHLLKEAQRLGLTEVRLEVKAENTSAVRLYERFGFHVTGEVPGEAKLKMTAVVR